MINEYCPRFPPDYYLVDCGDKYLKVIVTGSEKSICYFEAKKNLDRGDIVVSGNIELNL